jgi:hypothetical protein
LSQLIQGEGDAIFSHFIQGTEGQKCTIVTLNGGEGGGQSVVYSKLNPIFVGESKLFSGILVDLKMVS